MGTQKSVLVVEDEADLSEVIRFNLQREGYRCRCVVDGAMALLEIRRERPDAVVLDRMLPGISGDEVITQLRRELTTASIPVLMLTAKAEETDELVGFALGADDYIAKPCSMKVLIARLEALLRRSNKTEPLGNVLQVGPIELDRDRHELRVDGELTRVTSTEFGVLWQLMAAQGRVLSRDQLISAVLGTSVVVTDRTIDVHVAALRKKLGSTSALIQTIRGVGYTLRLPAGAGE